VTAGDQRTIGLDRPVKLEWLDAAAGRLASGDTPKAAREYVWDLLDGVVAGATAQTARGKTLTVISRVWLTPPVGVVTMRDAALRVLSQASADERLAIHWAMLCATYPFFMDVAGLVGKSLGLNGEVALAQLTRRLVDTWGDRSTLRPAAQRLVRSMVQWGVLREGGKVGLYLPQPKKTQVSSSVGELLLEGMLIAAQRGMPLSQLVSHPAVFPFDVRVDVTALRRSERLRLHRQGDQTDFVERENRPVAKPPEASVQPPAPSRSTKPRPVKGKTTEAKQHPAKAAGGSNNGKAKRKASKPDKQLPLFDKPPGGQ